MGYYSEFDEADDMAADAKRIEMWTEGCTKVSGNVVDVFKLKYKYYDGVYYFVDDFTYFQLKEAIKELLND